MRRGKGGPRRRFSPELVAAAAQFACLLEASAPKPGNVTGERPLPGLTYRQFVSSAAAMHPVFRRHAGGPVGRMILEGARATRRRVGTNTNLGILILLAPLARAAVIPGNRPLRTRLRRVLRQLDRRDAIDVYRAIRLARPGGLGRVPSQDVARPPTLNLLECMRLAAGHDAIASEYATDYSTTFDSCLPLLDRLWDRGVPLRSAIAQTYLAVLATRPDTLIRRRHGARRARAVSRSALLALRSGGVLRKRGRALMERLDRRLRAARPPLNPGASADLIAAALFVWILQREVSPRHPLRRSRSRRPDSSRES